MREFTLAKLLTIIGLSLFLLSSCIPQEQVEYVHVSPDKLTKGPVVWNGSVTVTSSESWHMTPIGNTDWCTVYPDKGVEGTTTVAIQIEALPHVSPRIAIYEIKTTSGLKRTLTIEQKDVEGDEYYFYFQDDPALSFSVSSFDVQPIRLSVLTNVDDWTASVSSDAGDWLIVEQTEDSLLISVTDIDEPKGREGVVTAVAGGSLNKILTFSQKGLHEYGAPTRNFSLSMPNVPDSELFFKDVYSKSRITLLFIWGSWCPGCTNFIPLVKQLHEEFKSHGLKIYGVALEEEGKEQDFLDSLNDNGLLDVDETTSDDIWWKNRPVFSPLEERKINYFTKMFYGDKLLTGEVKNFLPAFFFVDAGGFIIRTYTEPYPLNTQERIESLYNDLRLFLSRQLECCGG